MSGVIGQRVPRVEGQEKVTGGAKYAGDMILPSMLWGKVLRSPHASARIMSINVERARQVPGVHAVITGQDIPFALVGRRMKDLPVLARDVVRFPGERVAAVAAEDPDIAEEALTLIEVEYEEYEPLLDPEFAMTPEAPLLHPDVRSYEGVPDGLPDEPNVHSYVEWRRGDLDAGFAEADLVFENRFQSAPTHQAYLEPSACTVEIDASGKAHVWMCHKNPFVAQEFLAQALGLPDDQVVIEFTRIGGDFGGKGDLRDAPIAYHLAEASGRPVQIVMEYSEEFASASTRHGSIVELKTGVKRDGTIVAHQARVIFDGGAYAAYKPRPDVHPVGPRCAGSGYWIPNVLIQSYCVYTNHVPGGFMRAPGEPQVIFAVESHVDMIACELGIDPYELRARNLIEDGVPAATGEVFRDVQARRVLDSAVQAAGWHTPKPRPYVGRGLALSNQKVGVGISHGRITISPEGLVLVHTGVPDAGVGAHTMLRQVAATVLTIPLDLVHVVPEDTHTAPFDQGLGASRTTHVAGQAVSIAATDLAEQLKLRAAEYLACHEGSVALRDGQFVSDEAGRSLPFQDLARRANASRPLDVRSEYGQNKPDTECFCAQIAEVEVDPETGRVDVLSLVTANDTGTIINPLMVEGQIDGAVSQGFGFAVLEEVTIENGHVTNPHFGDYKIPTILDMPPLQRVFIEDGTGPGPFGARPVAEFALAPTGAAIANAIYDAVGVRLMETPLSAERVYRALRESRALAEVR
jgi:CO/xanthine dehydrogenase Mo-binding subunit